MGHLRIKGLYAGTLGIFDNQLVMNYFEGNSRKPSGTVGEFQSVARINQKPSLRDQYLLCGVYVFKNVNKL
jgi:hypothetical protein